MNFRTKLLVITIPIVVLAIGSLAMISYLSASGAIVANEKESMQLLVERTGAQLDAWFEDRVRDAKNFREIQVFKDACRGENLEEARAMLETLFNNSGFYEATLLMDTKGVIFMDGIQGKATGIHVAEIPVYKKNIDMAKAGQVWIGSVGKSPATGRPVSLITAPIYENGEYIGIIGTPIELNAFSKENIANIKIGESGYLFVSDATGLTLAHPNAEHILKTNITDYDFGKAMMAQKNGVYEYVWQGVDKISYFETNEKLGWIIAVTASKNEFLASVIWLKTISMIVGLVAILLVSVVTWLVTSGVFKTIASAVERLTLGGDQIGAASGQLSASSQMLAEGAAEQASSLEEVSSSLEEMASMTRNNSDISEKANQMMSVDARQSFEGIMSRMNEMKSAMDQSQSASQESVRVIKTIDEIAFQTNLLALNAAVEAARAGEAGKGFAVVAEEVRNLAQRAAEAARSTQEMIGNSFETINRATKLYEQVMESQNENAEVAQKVGQLIAEISAASREQSQGIEQINLAVSQMDKVTQSNASNAEETASSSEEMSSQAIALKSLVGDLSQIVGGVDAARGKSRSVSRQNEYQEHSMHSFKSINVNRNGNGAARRSQLQNSAPVRGNLKNSNGNGAGKNPASVIPFDNDVDFKDF